MAFSSFFFFKDTATPEIYPLSLHAALPISLTVINAAAGEIAADGYAQHRGTFEAAIGAPAQDAQLVANLHHGGPDVIEELDFGDRLESARGHADGPADDAGFG